MNWSVYNYVVVRGGFQKYKPMFCFFVKLVRWQNKKTWVNITSSISKGTCLFLQCMYILKLIFKVNLKRTHKSPIFIIFHFANMSTFTSSIVGFGLLCLLVDLYVICNSLWPCQMTFCRLVEKKKKKIVVWTEVWFDLHYNKKESYTGFLMRRHYSQCSKHHTHWIGMFFFSVLPNVKLSLEKKKTTQFWQTKKITCLDLRKISHLTGLSTFPV